MGRTMGPGSGQGARVERAVQLMRETLIFFLVMMQYERDRVRADNIVVEEIMTAERSTCQHVMPFHATPRMFVMPA